METLFLSGDSLHERRTMNWYKTAAWDPVSDGKYRDENKEWSVSSIIKHAEDLPLVMMDVEDLVKTNRTTETKEGLFGDLIENPSAAFKERCNRADLSYPILVDAHGWLIDGAHRLTKAKWAGRSSIEAKVVDMSKVSGGRELNNEEKENKK